MCSTVAKMAPSLVIFGHLLAAVLAISNNIPYDYGYDDGHRGPLLQLYDGLNIQDYILRDSGNSEIGSFLPNADSLLNREDTRLKDLTLGLIRAAKHLEIVQEELEGDAILQVAAIVLEKVIEDGCTYLKQSLLLSEDFNCTLPNLISLHNRIELADHITATLDVIYTLLPERASIGPDDQCAYWNAHVLNNCTVSSPELESIQETIIVPQHAQRVGRRTSMCTFCPIANTTTATPNQ